MIKTYLLSVIKGTRQGFIAFLVKIVLSFLSFIYFLIIEARDILYKANIIKAHSLPRPVVSIGNITTGGTGKTPLVEALAKKLTGQGRAACVLMRGYGGDEDKIFRENIPGVSVCVGKDRVKEARRFLDETPCDIFLLDDGFQYRRLKRDLEIVAIDATEPFGNRRLLPRGILREPLKALARADIFVLTKSDLSKKSELEDLRQRLTLLNRDALVVGSVHKPLRFYSVNTKEDISLDVIRGKKVAAVCGIGDPSSFETTLERLGAAAALSYRFPDHHKYSREDLEKIFNDCDNFYVDTIVITQKDFVNMKNILDGTRYTVHGTPIDILVLRMELEFVNDEERVFDRLYRLCSG